MSEEKKDQAGPPDAAASLLEQRLLRARLAAAAAGEAPVSFGQAIEELKRGGRVRRLGWNGKGMWLALQRPDAHSKMSLPYIYMSTVQGDLVPWLASQSDMLADDWEVLP